MILRCGFTQMDLADSISEKWQDETALAWAYCTLFPELFGDGLVGWGVQG